MTSYGMAKEKRIEIFKDTEAFIRKNPNLSSAVERSIGQTILYAADRYPDIGETADADGEIIVSKRRSFEAAMQAHKEFPDGKICVLNFASATNPGGGVVNGSSAQEESLCRCSTLFPVLKTDALWQQYYGKNRANWNLLHTDECIYTPGIVICKSDTDAPQRLPENQWVMVDVISCAAPNLRKRPGNMHNQEYSAPLSITKG